MRRLMLSVLAGSLVTACSGSMPAAPGSIAGGTGSTAEKPSGVVRNWTVHLTGADEVPTRDTPAQGQAIFQLSADGTELSWRLIASNIDNITQAHIHRNNPGADPLTTTGGIVLWLAGTGTFRLASSRRAAERRMACCPRASQKGPISLVRWLASRFPR